MIGVNRKKTFYILGILFALLAVTLGTIKLYRVKEARQQGILLAFDDYSAENWTSHFDLFDEYDVKATFFVNCGEPTDFCYEARERGHEIGFHTAGHISLTEASAEEIQENVYKPIEAFREKGIEVTTFAYPYGQYTEELNEELLQHFKILRGAYYYQIYNKANLRHGFVESCSLDNINYGSDEEFEEAVTRMLTEVSQHPGDVVSLYSHAIEGGDWCVSEDRLIFLFEKAKELDLKFYTFQDLQDE